MNSGDDGSPQLEVDVSATAENYGWMSVYPALQSTDPTTIRSALERFVADCGLSQTIAWDRSIPIVKSGTAVVLAGYTFATRFSAIFEYELPREGGRRPDVVLLQNGVVVVLEFKDRATIASADLDQVSAYARDLKNYHEYSHDLEVVPVLIPTRYRGERRQVNGVEVIPPTGLGRFLDEQASRELGDPIVARQWIDAEYAPMPTLITAARMLFENEPLPRIKRAESARIPEVVDLILGICHEAARSQARHVVLLTGVPGSGKTLVGLQVAHHRGLEDLRVRRQGRNNGAPAVFLSGNGPLVQVLQDALGSTVFVAGMKKFVEYYLFKRPSAQPSTHVIVFDEAQRAWDAEHMAAKHEHAISEPAALLSIGERIPQWSVLLALIGEGQEIHKGEEAGLAGWVDALNSPERVRWTVHAPLHVAAEFRTQGSQVKTNPLLNLSTTLRSHLAADVHSWVAQVLDHTSDPATTRTLADDLKRSGFPIYVSRDLEAAREYVRSRYADGAKRYGLLASRYAKNLLNLGLDNVYHFERERQLDLAKWFNAPVNDPQSCCALARPASEFDCQGLELDFPIVCWGDDLVWKSNEWMCNPRVRKTLHDPFKVTINAYRVLMTRGRDGQITFVPPDPALDGVARRLVACGAEPVVDADGETQAE